MSSGLFLPSQVVARRRLGAFFEPFLLPQIVAQKRLGVSSDLFLLSVVLRKKYSYLLKLLHGASFACYLTSPYFSKSLHEEDTLA